MMIQVDDGSMTMGEGNGLNLAYVWKCNSVRKLNLIK